MGVDARMFVRTREKLDADQVRRLSAELAGCFDPEKFLISKDDGRHALQFVDVYEQDGPDIRPEPGETFVQVHLYSSYYGVGYERGDLPLLIAVADWLERRIPGAEVWYGGDSSGICARKFDRQAREALFGYFVERGHEPYEAHFDRLGGVEKWPTCGFCKVGMHNCGRGPGATERFYCPGCGDHQETKDGGRTLTPVKREDQIGTPEWRAKTDHQRALVCFRRALTLSRVPKADEIVEAAERLLSAPPRPLKLAALGRRKKKPGPSLKKGRRAGAAPSSPRRKR